MNRKHTAADYQAVIERIRAARPDVALSSDFIVGFPGETRADFEATLALVRSVGFASAYSFKYSSRPGTRAATMDAQVDEQEKVERLAELQRLLEEQRQAFNAKMVGASTQVLFEKAGRHPNQFIGKSPYLQAVYVESADSLIGAIRDVAIVKCGPNALRGALNPSDSR
jgi:tRNA-2-methylthio-N6-dimethylallyladenosine synthase